MGAAAQLSPVPVYGFVPVQRRAFLELSLTGPDRYILTVFLDLVARAQIDDGPVLGWGEVLIDRRSVAARNGVSERAARRALVVLTQRGLLELVRPGAGRRPAVGRITVFEDYCRTTSRTRKPLSAKAGPKVSQIAEEHSSGKIGASAHERPPCVPKVTQIGGGLPLYRETTEQPPHNARARAPTEAPAGVVVDSAPPQEEGKREAPVAVATPRRAPATPAGSQEGQEPSQTAGRLGVVPAPTPDATDALVTDLIALWNACRRRELGEMRHAPEIRVAPGSRDWRKLRAAVEADADFPGWERVFLSIAGTAYLCGNNPRSWWADLLWAVGVDREDPTVTNRSKVTGGRFGPVTPTRAPRLTPKAPAPAPAPEPMPAPELAAPPAPRPRVSLGDWREVLRGIPR